MSHSSEYWGDENKPTDLRSPFSPGVSTNRRVSEVAEGEHTISRADIYNDDTTYMTKLLQRKTRRMSVGNTARYHYHDRTGSFVSYSNGE